MGVRFCELRLNKNKTNKKEIKDMEKMNENLSAIQNLMGAQTPAPKTGAIKLQLAKAKEKVVESEKGTFKFIELTFQDANKTNYDIDMFAEHVPVFLQQMKLAFNIESNDVISALADEVHEYFITTDTNYNKFGQAMVNYHINEQKTIIEQRK